MSIGQQYHKRIKNLNINHYSGEVSYYSNAELRPAENTLLNSLPTGAKILDVGCGSGRFSVAAAKKGFNVTGVDITPSAIRSCIAQAKKLKLSNTTFKVLDIVDEGMDEKYDYVFCPRFVINAIATKQCRKSAIKNMITACEAGGCIFIESFNIWYMGRGFKNPIKNSFIGVYRIIKLNISKVFGLNYKGLFPGDIVYQANKVANAPVGYAHLPNIFEIRKYLNNSQTKSIHQIIGLKKHDLLKPFRYSIWVMTSV